MVLAVGQAVLDQARQLPPRAPTQAESLASRPEAERVWAGIERKLQTRLRSDRPLEVGEVWATRRFRICGYANARSSAVDDMTPFFSVDDEPQLKGDDIFVYVLVWQECLKDRWVELHVGAEQTGKCGSKHFRGSVLGHRICPAQDRIWARSYRP